MFHAFSLIFNIFSFLFNSFLYQSKRKTHACVFIQMCSMFDLGHWRRCFINDDRWDLIRSWYYSKVIGFPFRKRKTSDMINSQSHSFENDVLQKVSLFSTVLFRYWSTANQSWSNWFGKSWRCAPTWLSSCSYSINNSFW
jgi:hypothetical protein